MRPDAFALVWDAHHASDLIAEFIDGKGWQDYQGDALLRSGVERQFEIIGESLNRLGRVDPGAAEMIPDLRRIVGFRNVLIHG